MAQLEFRRIAFRNRLSRLAKAAKRVALQGGDEYQASGADFDGGFAPDQDCAFSGKDIVQRCVCIAAKAEIALTAQFTDGKRIRREFKLIEYMFEIHVEILPVFRTK